MTWKRIWLGVRLPRLLVCGAGWWADRQLRQTIQQELRGDLQSTLDANVTALEIWMENQKHRRRWPEAALSGGRPRVVRRSGGITNRTAFGEGVPAVDHARAVGGAVAPGAGYGMAQLVSTNLTIIADTGRRGRNGEPVFEELESSASTRHGWPILITPFKLKPPENGLQIARVKDGRHSGSARVPMTPTPPPRSAWTTAPARLDRDASGRTGGDSEGRTRGVLSLILNPDAEFTRILSVARSDGRAKPFAFDVGG